MHFAHDHTLGITRKEPFPFEAGGVLAPDTVSSFPNIGSCARWKPSVPSVSMHRTGCLQAACIKQQNYK